MLRALRASFNKLDLKITREILILIDIRGYSYSTKNSYIDGNSLPLNIYETIKNIYVNVNGRK